MIAPSAYAFYTRPLSRLGADDIDEFGERITRLGEAISYGHSGGQAVLDGFAVSVAGYDRFIRCSGVGEWISELLGAVKSDLSNVPSIGAAIHSAIMSADLPREMGREIRSVYTRLAEDADRMRLPVAVFPSAIKPLPSKEVQDAGGLQFGRLVACNEEALLQACRRCYAIAFSDRAIAFRFTNNLSLDAARIAVGIQRAAHSDAAAADVVSAAIPLRTTMSDQTVMSRRHALETDPVPCCPPTQSRPDHRTASFPSIDRAVANGDNEEDFLEPVSGNKATHYRKENENEKSPQSHIPSGRSRNPIPSGNEGCPQGDAAAGR